MTNIAEKFAAFSEHWSPMRIARVNDHELRIAKIAGAFVWHAHAGSDELFLVWKGAFEMHYRDRVVALGEGDVHVVPAGVEHKPVAAEECWILMIEPTGVRNTGDAGGARTVAVTDL